MNIVFVKRIILIIEIIRDRPGNDLLLQFPLFIKCAVSIKPFHIFLVVLLKEAETSIRQLI
jgi:hypothetical protein